MCAKRTNLDERIGLYRRIASNLSDKLTTLRINELILKLEAEKAALHPEGGP
jgi:hypothetical protein